MDTQILKAIEHIKNISKKKPDPVKIFNYLQNNVASNYDYMSVVQKVQELVIKGIIDDKYRIIIPIIEAQNVPQEDDVILIQTTNEEDILIPMPRDASRTQSSTELSTTVVETSLTTDINTEESPTFRPQALLNTPTNDDQGFNNYNYLQCQIDKLKEDLEKEIKSNREFKDTVNARLKHEGIRNRDESDILHERIVTLEKENSCLKNEIKNQHYIIQMLTKENNVNEWKTCREENVNATLKLKAPTPIVLNNRFDMLNQEIDGDKDVEDTNPDVTPTRLIPNAKPKSREHVRNTTKTSCHNRRPEVAITENYIRSQKDQPQKIVPGRRTYASATKYGKKVCIVGDSHLRRIRKNVFNNSINDGKAFITGFSGANIKRLDHYITPILEEDRPDIVIIHVGCNDVTFQNLEIMDVKDLSKRLIDIGKKCKSYGVEEVIFSSILVKKQIKLTKIIRQVNDALRAECVRNDFHFVDNNNVTREYLYTDGVHLNNDGTRLFAGNLVNFLNDFIFTRNA